MRYVARGRYESGPRKGQQCVVKWLKSGMTNSRTKFKHDLSVVDETLSITEKWNASRLIDQPIRVNIPALWRLSRDFGSFEGTRVLVEPYIEGFQKCEYYLSRVLMLIDTDKREGNSNTGWCDISKPWGRVMQALSHYSYHVTNGRLLLCDLQGGTYDTCAIVTDPVICSTTASYGPTDMSDEGISSFFALHSCNEYCRRSWKKPSFSRSHLTAVKSTSSRGDT